ncbi:alanyl-tRNA editing protein [Albirhodobacter sp. R86504]|uniref:alanyl-tRNA editing protein n=1 Tax=Albirhodobacter sp. R86504 TaxID=3093848 RepID=UPI003670E8AE
MIFTQSLYLDAPNLREADAIVLGRTAEGGIILDRSIFAPAQSGYPGDSGRLAWSIAKPYGPPERMETIIATTLRSEGRAPILLSAEPYALPPLGARVVQHLDWERRHRLMRMHTALHLLSITLPRPVLGAKIGAKSSWIELGDLPETAHARVVAPVDISELEAGMNRLVAMQLPVASLWKGREVAPSLAPIYAHLTRESLGPSTRVPATVDETQARGGVGLLRARSEHVTRAQHALRLVRIGAQDAPLDVQPCAGPHVSNTAEIGRIHVQIKRAAQISRAEDERSADHLRGFGRLKTGETSLRLWISLA